MTRRLPVCAALLGVLLTATASAHRVNLLVLPDGDSVRGQVYFADGSPVAGAEVAVQRPTGERIGTVTTDADGRFTHTPAEKSDLIFVVETDDGHRAEAAFDSGSSALHEQPAPPGAADRTTVDAQVQHAVQREIAPLREQLDAFQQEIRFRDILGGIGYIVGVLGLLAWGKSRRAAHRA